MSDDSQRPIVVKKIKKGGHGHHGGAWKIAYADFVTAMMAFFLLMWLLGSVTKGDLKGISDYFRNPLKVTMAGGPGSGASESVLQGGGMDLTKAAGTKKKGPTDDKRKTFDDLKELKKKIEAKVNATPQMTQYKDQIKLDITPDGLRIQIVDEKNRPMFQSGSGQMEPYAAEILREIASLLNSPSIPNKVSLSGHTDSSAFGKGLLGYSNWELSADRANSSRRELIAGGMAPDKVLRVMGLADAVPFSEQTDPAAPINRRISIIVLTPDAEAGIRKAASEEASQDVPAMTAADAISAGVQAADSQAKP